jgi:hypothetical protein
MYERYIIGLDAANVACEQSCMLKIIFVIAGTVGAKSGYFYIALITATCSYFTKCAFNAYASLRLIALFPIMFNYFISHRYLLYTFR